MTFRINVWGARGRWFESSHPDIVESIDNLMIVDAFCFLSLLVPLPNHGIYQRMIAIFQGFLNLLLFSVIPRNY